MKKTATFFCLILFASGYLAAQSALVTWRLFPTGKGDAEKTIQIAQDSFLTIGKVKKYAYAFISDRFGKQLAYRSFKNTVGGTRSEFTDIVKTDNGYLIAGDCDACVEDPEDTTRKVLLLETDKNLKIIRSTRLAPPTHPTKHYLNWGYQYIRRDGDKYVVLSQLTYKLPSDDTLRFDFALSRFGVVNNQHKFDFYRPFHFHWANNIADLQVRSDNYYVMAWTGSKPEIGSDTTSIYAFSRTGDMLAEHQFPGVCRVLQPIGQNDWVVAGTYADNVFDGPQAHCYTINGLTWQIKNQTHYGGELMDAIVDLKVLPDGNFLVLSAEDCSYPDISTLSDLNDVFLYSDRWPHPKQTRVIRLNANTLQFIGDPFVFTYSNGKDVILRSIVPLNTTGSQFVACGQLNRRPLFYSIATANFADDPNSAKPDDGSGDTPSGNDGRGDSAGLAFWPNPVRAGQPFQLSLPDLADDQEVAVEIHDRTGRLISSFAGKLAELPLYAPVNSGVYFLRVNMGTEWIGRKFLVD